MALATLSRTRGDHRPKLLELLLQAGHISRETAADLKVSLATWPDDQHFISYLVEHHVVTEEVVNQTFARVFGIPYLPSLGEAPISIIQMIPEAICREYVLAPFKLERKTLFIALADPLHVKENQPGVLAGLKKSTGFGFQLVMTSRTEFDRVMSTYPKTRQADLKVSDKKPILPPSSVVIPSHNDFDIEDHFATGSSISLVQKQIPMVVLQKVPENVARRYRFVAFGARANNYSIASEHPKDRNTIELWRFLETANKVHLSIYATDSASIDAALAQYPTAHFASQGQIDLHTMTIAPLLLHKIPRQVAEKHRFMIFGQSDRQFKIAAENPDDPMNTKIWRYIEQHNQVKLAVYTTTKASLDVALSLYKPILPRAEAALIEKPDLQKLALLAHRSESPVSKPAEPSVGVDSDDGGAPTTFWGNIFGALGIAPKPKIITQSLVSPSKPAASPAGAVQAPSQAVLPTPTAVPQPTAAVKPVQEAPASVIVQTTTGPTIIQTDAAGIPIQNTAQTHATSGDIYHQVAKISQHQTDEDDLGSLLEKDVSSLEELKSMVKSGFIPKIVAGMISYAITLRASDVHIEAENEDVRVRYRVDGMLQDVVHLPFEQQAAIVSRIKILSKLKIDETRIPQDGRFDVKFKDREVDLRVSAMPTVHGEKIVMRILDKSHGIMSLEELGVLGRAFDCIIDAIKQPYGVVLSTGPTGSGKSTTLYAILNRISVPTVNVITLEDPVEYEIEGVNQSQIKPKIGFTFAEGLRSVLRQDPNIIMVGEIRDAETASMATHAALTGHLVLSTLHTNDAPGALPRLINMGIEPFLITSSINVVEAQRLVRKVCQNCKERVQIPPAVVAEIQQELETIPHNNTKDRARIKAPLTFYHGKGCDRCQNGYRGRIGIYEVMPMSEAIEDLAIRKVAAADIQKQAIVEGMITMKQDGLLKALTGLTTVDEVLRESSV